jgi:hypothetical protein
MISKFLLEYQKIRQYTVPLHWPRACSTPGRRYCSGSHSRARAVAGVAEEVVHQQANPHPRRPHSAVFRLFLKSEIIFSIYIC